MTEQEELIRFVRTRLDEARRLSLSLGVSTEMNSQAAADQMERLIDSVNEVVTFIQYFESYPTQAAAPERKVPLSPLSIPILKKIANKWSYHSDFNPNW